MEADTFVQMRPSLLLRAALALVACLALVATAVAARPRPVVYKGTTAQIHPSTDRTDPGKPFTISFRVTRGRVGAIRVVSRDLCRDGTHLQVDQTAFGSAKIDRRGRFVLRAGDRVQPAVLRGTIKGATARGTISDRSYVSERNHMLCKSSTTWTARRA